MHSTQVQYVQADLHVRLREGHYLEVGVELLHEASSGVADGLLDVRRVVIHRITLREPSQFDGALRDLIREAWESVGPGLR